MGLELTKSYILERLIEVKWDYEKKARESSGQIQYEAKLDLDAIELAIEFIKESYAKQ